MSTTIARASGRIGGASGILALVLSLGGFGLIGGAGLALQPGASHADIREALADGDPGMALMGVYLDTLGTLLLVVFAACLWSRLRTKDGPDWLPLAAFGAGLGMVAAGLGDKAAYHAIFTRADAGIDVGAAAALYDVATGFFTLFYAMGGLFLVLASAAALGAAALPRWLARAGVVVGALAILSGADSAGGMGQTALPLVFLWIVAVSITLWRDGSPSLSLKAHGDDRLRRGRSCG